jgi:hypothetical protein
MWALLRVIVVHGLVLLTGAAAHAQTLNLAVPPAAWTDAQAPAVSAQMDPIVKGAIIGAAAGAGALGLFGWWYCTRGPGECSAENWKRAVPLCAAIGAGAGVVIGAIRC